MTGGQTVCLRDASVDALGNTGHFTSPVCRTAPVDDRSGRVAGKAKRVTGNAYYGRTATQFLAKGAWLKLAGVRASTRAVGGDHLQRLWESAGAVRHQGRQDDLADVGEDGHKKVVGLPTAGWMTTITIRTADKRKVVIDGLVLRAR